MYLVELILCILARILYHYKFRPAFMSFSTAEKTAKMLMDTALFFTLSVAFAGLVLFNSTATVYERFTHAIGSNIALISIAMLLNFFSTTPLHRMWRLPLAALAWLVCMATSMLELFWPPPERAFCRDTTMIYRSKFAQLLMLVWACWIPLLAMFLVTRLNISDNQDVIISWVPRPIWRIYTRLGFSLNGIERRFAVYIDFVLPYLGPGYLYILVGLWNYFGKEAKSVEGKMGYGEVMAILLWLLVCVRFIRWCYSEFRLFFSTVMNINKSMC